MTKITIKTDCGHSPKKEFLKDFNAAFGKGNTEFLTANVTDDIVWTMVGNKVVEGKEAFAKAIQKMADYKVSECVIEKIVTHGKEGAVNGVMKMDDGKEYAFSDFYEFKNTKSTDLKTITSYLIQI
ncbi:MAG: nuclear transport factor 2 family protein [Arenibacter sp.]